MIEATCVLIEQGPEYPVDVLDSLPDFDELIIETDCPSIYRRYELASKAKNDLIYIQDSDCITDIPTLIGKYNGFLTNALSRHHQKFYKDSGITLVGFGTFFPKKMLDKFKIYLDKFGIDDLFLSQADRVFTYFNQPFNSVDIHIEVLPRSYGKDRMSTSLEHWNNLRRITQRLHSLKSVAQ
jgi:hypothetical protein